MGLYVTDSINGCYWAVHPTYDSKDEWDLRRLGGVKLSERLSFAGKEKYSTRNV